MLERKRKLNTCYPVRVWNERSKKIGKNNAEELMVKNFAKYIK